MQKISPDDIQAIGELIAIRWSDGREDFYGMSHLRAVSPSASNRGETDLLGNLIGGGEDAGKDFSGVLVTGWAPVGGYAIQFQFSDGHNSGLYGFDFLREVGDAIREQKSDS
ncbi:MAG: DUF971 domain-containing protein [Verrucomicrobiales bacterium]|nr:DUF971 domain-containing protein [Verrucomicrobiales bacterium]